MDQNLSDKISFLVEEYEVALVRYANSILKDHEQARDVVQDTFIKLIKALQEKKEIQNEKSWLYRVCHNSALDYLRKIKRRQEKNEEVMLSTSESEINEAPDKQLNRKEDKEFVNESLNRLSEREQQILNLKIKDGLSYKEIAAELDLTVNNVGFILHRTMKKLSAIFKEKNKEEVCR